MGRSSLAQSALMKQGLEGLFNPKNQFESEADYGKKILKVAWTVEILAALTGLFIAWGQGYDVYSSIENPTTSHLLGAIMGALPFVIIAVIEPTKIPLAGGFYKTKIFGWKMLILASLLGLTIVTFETMFNGLERNLTNVTKQVTDANNKILFLSNSIEEKNRKLGELEGISETGSTSGITGAIRNLDDDYNNFIGGENQSVTDQTASFRQRLAELETQRAGLAGQLGNDAKAGIDLLSSQIAGLKEQISAIQKTTEDKINDYKDSLAAEGAQNSQSKSAQINQLKSQKQDKQKEIAQITSQTSAEEAKLNSKITEMSAELDKKIATIDRNMASASKGKLFGKATVEKPFKDRKDRAIADHQSNKRRLTNGFDQLKGKNDKRFDDLTKDIAKIDIQLSQLASETSAAPILDPKIIERLRSEGNSEAKPLKSQIAKIQKDINSKIEAQSGVAQSKGAALDAEIKQLNQRIDEIKQASDKRISERKGRYEVRRQEIEAARNKTILSTSAEKEQIPILRKEIETIQEEIDANKKIKRDKAYDSQIYRLAALAYGRNDVADVTTEEIKMVSVIWFGTVATIVATTGTVLALISYILRDPEAFVERKKVSLTRRLRRLFYLFFGRLSRILLSFINVLTALTKLILSFAEIFRGLVGAPVQRSFRRMLLAYRKRLQKPRIETVEVEVDKIVEVEVEKIVEVEVEKIVEVEVEKIVEVEVEKIVEVEVPVDKIVIQEVPVEIIRKELVYVPLYSTESGLIDASTQLKDATPKLGGDHKDEPKGGASVKKEVDKDETPKKAAQKKRGK